MTSQELAECENNGEEVLWVCCAGWRLANCFQLVGRCNSRDSSRELWRTWLAAQRIDEELNCILVLTYLQSLGNMPGGGDIIVNRLWDKFILVRRLMNIQMGLIYFRRLTLHWKCRVEHFMFIFLCERDNAEVSEGLGAYFIFVFRPYFLQDHLFRNDMVKKRIKLLEFNQCHLPSVKCGLN